MLLGKRCGTRHSWGGSLGTECICVVPILFRVGCCLHDLHAALVCRPMREYGQTAAHLHDGGQLPDIRFDWGNTIFSIIGAADIVEVFDSCQLLVRAALNRQTLDDDDETIPDMLADESELMQAIADSIMIHHCPPVGLGAKRTNVKHRLQAFYHQMYLETGSSYLMRRVLNSIETCTGDLGTESGFPSAPSIAFASALPYVQNNDDDDDGDDLAAAQVSLDLHGLFVFQGVV
jgi:hypothetical protein